MDNIGEVDDRNRKGHTARVYGTGFIAGVSGKGRSQRWDVGPEGVNRN